MVTSVTELYHRQVNMNPQKSAAMRLFVDLDVCASCDCADCEARCSYLYHPDNNGVISVNELATYYLVCRRCDEPHCVNACPREALEQQKDKGKLLVRHTMRCVSCKTCSHACPYGTIYPTHVPLLIQICDYCLDRRQTPNEPLCVTTCTRGALSLKAGDSELGDDTFLVGDHLIVHSTHWRREKA